jgi:peptide subunit release factor 1 (eRF1)
VVESLSKIVRTEKIDKIFLGGDEVVLPKIREHLTSDLKPLIANELKLDINTPDAEIMIETLEAARAQDGSSAESKVKQLLDAFRAGGLGVIGARDTLAALTAGQANELIISADPGAVKNDLRTEEAELIASGTPVTDPTDRGPQEPKIAEALILKAKQTGAEITFIENPDLLAQTGGAGAFLRFRIERRA